MLIVSRILGRQLNLRDCWSQSSLLKKFQVLFKICLKSSTPLAFGFLGHTFSWKKRRSSIIFYGNMLSLVLFHCLTFAWSAVCVHGTYRKNLESILASGLKRMKRLHVHFSCGLPTDGEVISGNKFMILFIYKYSVFKLLSGQSSSVVFVYTLQYL